MHLNMHSSAPRDHSAPLPVLYDPTARAHRVMSLSGKMLTESYMNYLADRNLQLQDRKVHLLSRNPPSERTARSRGLQRIACAMTLLLAASCAHAQFGVQPVGASSGSQSITVTATDSSNPPNSASTNVSVNVAN